MNVKNIYKCSLVLGLFVTLVFVYPVKAFGVSPVKILTTIEANTSQTVVLKIENSEKKDLVFKLGVLGVKQDDSGKPLFERGVTEAENWVYPENSTLLVKTGQTKSVNFIIKIPKNTLAGSYYVGLFVEPSSGESASSNVSTKLVSLLTVQVAGTVNESILIDKWLAKQNISKDREWQFDLSLKNNGDVEVPLKGILSIRNWKGEDIFAEPLVLGNKLIAGSRRVLSPTIILRDDIKLPGLYQSQIKINYGLTNQVSSAITYVWFFPQWSQVFLVIFGILIFGLVVFVVKRKK